MQRRRAALLELGVRRGRAAKCCEYSTKFS